MASTNQGGSSSPTSPRRVRAAQRQQQAIELALAGVPLAKIAERLGYASHSGARKAILAGLQATLRPPSQALRQLWYERLEKLWFSAYPRALQGDLDALDRCLAVARQAFGLMGLTVTKLRLGGDDEAPPLQVQQAGPDRADAELLGLLTVEELRALRDIRDRLLRDHPPGPGPGAAQPGPDDGPGPNPGGEEPV